MPTILRWGPYRAYFYSNENAEPAHVHVRASDKEVKLWLHDFTVAANAGFSTHEIGDIIHNLRPRRESLKDAWNEHFGNRGR